MQKLGSFNLLDKKLHLVNESIWIGIYNLCEAINQ